MVTVDSSDPDRDGTDHRVIASVYLTPQDAREIAAELLRLADAHDAKAGAK
jgi:hypothetical protein